MFWDLITYKIFVNDRFYRYLWIFLIRFYQTGFKKVSHMVFILKGGQFSMFKIVLNLKCCLRDDRILKVTFKQNLLKRDLPSELGYFNISDQNYTLIHLSTKLLFESQGYTNVIIEFTNPFVIWVCANLKYTSYWLPSVWNMSNLWNISTVWKHKNSNEKLGFNLMGLRLYKFMK